MIKRFLGFSAMEWAILTMGIVGFLCLQICFPLHGWKIYCCGFGLGFLFESGMEKLFTYHIQLSEKHCIANTDVNFLFPFAWLNTVGLTTLVAEKVLSPVMPLFVSYILGALIVGNITEFIFFKCKFWVYNYTSPMFGNFKPFVPVCTICGVPIQVMIGYCNVGIMIFFLVHILY